jgi:hypothetical protein
MQESVYVNFENWCHNQNIQFQSNDKFFYVDDKGKKYVKPDYLLEGDVYVKIINSIPRITQYRKTFEEFKEIYGTILVFSSHVISELESAITKKDVEKEFGISLTEK